MSLSIGFGDILADVPRDGTAIALYTLLALCVLLVWFGSRTNRASRIGGSRKGAR